MEFEFVKDKVKRSIVFLAMLLVCVAFLVPAWGQEQQVGGYPHLQQLHVPFTGSWRPGDNPLLIEPGDFADIKNMRPTNTGIKGVSGYSKINTSVVNATYLKIRNGFHFLKDDETHVLVQAFNSGLTASKVYENTTAIPSAGDFTATELHTDTSGAGKGRFATASQGAMVYCNGADRPQVWTGDEGKVMAFITSTAAIGNEVTNPRDYTSRIQNTLQTSDEVAIIGGGTAFSMLLHCDGVDASTTFTDTVGTHTPVATGNAQLDTTQFKFGTASGLLDGTGDYVSVPDHADWYMGTGAFTIDGWFRFDTLDLLDSYTVLQLSCDGTDAATSFPDDSCSGHTVTANGDAQVDTAQYKFSTASALFDGTGDYLSIPDSDDWYMGANPVTIDFWVRFDDVSDHIAFFEQWVSSTEHCHLVWDTATEKIIWRIMSSGSYVVDLQGSWSPVVDTWYHIALVRGWNGNINDWAICVNGLSIATLTDDSPWPNFVGADFRIGYYGYATYYHSGWIDEFRVSKGAARWTAEFIPDTSPYPSNIYAIFFNQQVDADNFARLYYDTCSDELKFSITVAASETVAIAGTWVPVVDTWYHLAAIRGWLSDANTWAITVNGNDVGTTSSEADPWPDLAAAFDIGKCDDTGFVYFDGWLDEFRVWKGTAAWTDDFTPPSRAYGTASGYGLIGSPYRLNGVKFYVSSANTTTSTLAFEEFTGVGWSSLSVSDSTSSGGIALAQTGWVTWPTTETTSEQKLISGFPWFWYQYYLSAGTANVYRVTTDAPFQNITNIWDGSYSVCVGAKVCEATNSDYFDYTDEVNSDLTSDVLVLDSLEATNDYLLLGFTERQQGLEISIPTTNLLKGNSTANTTLAVYYSTGDAWVAVSNLYDGTEVGSISLNRSGVITWSPPSKSEEFPHTIAGETGFYYYKLVWDENLDAETEVYFIEGIPVTEDILPYAFSLHFQNRTLLFNRDGSPSEVRVSAENAPYILNGPDSAIFNIGTATGLTAAASLSNSYESSIDAVAIACKDSETWALREPGDGGPNFIQHKLSGTIGCPAPLTMKACEIAPGLNVVMWLSYDGPQLSEGTTVKSIPGIEPYFDPLDSLFVGYSALENASAFIDPRLKEYNLIIGDNWLIYDIQRSKWTKKEPPSYPECGWIV